MLLIVYDTVTLTMGSFCLLKTSLQYIHYHCKVCNKTCNQAASIEGSAAVSASERLKYFGSRGVYHFHLTANFCVKGKMEDVVKLFSLCLVFVSVVLGVEIIDVVEQSVFGQGNGE
jgi:hypothetical protein